MTSSACRPLLYLAGLAVLLGSSGCALTVDKAERDKAHAEFVSEHEGLSHWSVRGRAALRAAGEGATLSLRWRQIGGVFDIHLSGPFGAGAVRVSGQPGAVILDDGSGQPRSAQEPETLFAMYTGYDLPISALRYWILGIAAQGLRVERKELDAAGRPQVMVQDGWRIEYRRWSDVEGIHLPARVDIHKGSKQLRVALSGWQLGNE